MGHVRVGQGQKMSSSQIVQPNDTHREITGPCQESRSHSNLIPRLTLASRQGHYAWPPRQDKACEKCPGSEAV